MSLGSGIVLFIIGAILAFAVNIQVDWVDLHLIGYILMIAGVIAIVLSFAMTRRRPVGYTTTRESQVDPVSGSRVDRTDVDPR